MEKSFSLGELRILYVLFLLLLAPTGARPTSVLKLRYRDIRVVLSRDLDSSPHKVLIRFTLEFTKTYLGIKDAYIPRPSRGIVTACTRKGAKTGYKAGRLKAGVVQRLKLR